VQVKYWREWALAHDVDFINHFDDFVLGGSEQDRADFIWEHYIWGDVHLNEKGHQLIATRLVEHLGESRSFQ
jgi:lysophospholipase L1-like esterase